MRPNQIWMALALMATVVVTACAQSPAPAKAPSVVSEDDPPCLRLAPLGSSTSSSDADKEDAKKDEDTKADDKNDEEEEDEEEDCSTTSSSNTTIPTSTSIGSFTDKDYFDLENPAKLKECHDKKLMYDRNESVKACTSATLDQSWCSSVDTAKAQFGTSAAAFESAMTTHTGNGFKLDQCGKLGDKAVVMLIKRTVNETTKLPSIETKTLTQQ